MNASVKVMNSYDYCHFEVALSKEEVSLEDVDNLRKEAQRLVDKAIAQYKIAKSAAAKLPSTELEHEALFIKKEVPESERTPRQQAIVKAYEDFRFESSRRYDYEDDWLENQS